MANRSKKGNIKSYEWKLTGIQKIHIRFTSF